MKLKAPNMTYTNHLNAIMKETFLLKFKHQLATGHLGDDFLDLHVSDAQKRDFLPIVVLLGGVQGSGKSTFVDYCRERLFNVVELSTADCCKELVRIMSQMEPDGSALCKHIEDKDDIYRSLLHELKTLWCDADDGPNSIVCHQIMEKAESNYLMFVNVREPDQIHHIKELIEHECELPVVTLAIIRSEPEDSETDGDRTTLEYPYDLYIKNFSSLEELELRAKQFCYAVYSANNTVTAMLLNMLS